MILLILLVFIWFLEGVADGILWSRKGPDAFEGNEHTLLWIKRLLITFIAFFPVHFLLVLASVFLFPLIHNGAYFETRKDISGGTTYPDGWKSEPSPFSTAKINFSFKQRVLGAVIGIVIIVLYIIFL
jgi:hypothetical protein